MNEEGPEIERSQDDETGVQEITLEEDFELGSGDDEDSMLNTSSEDEASDESGSTTNSKSSSTLPTVSTPIMLDSVRRDSGTRSPRSAQSKPTMERFLKDRSEPDNV